MIFPPFHKPAIDLEYIGRLYTMRIVCDVDYNPAAAADDNLITPGSDMFIVLKGQLKRKNQGHNSYFDDETYVNATSIDASSSN